MLQVGAGGEDSLQNDLTMIVAIDDVVNFHYVDSSDGEAFHEPTYALRQQVYLLSSYTVHDKVELTFDGAEILEVARTHPSANEFKIPHG